MDILTYFKVVGIAVFVFMVTVFPFIAYRRGFKTAIKGAMFSIAFAFVIYTLFRFIVVVLL